MAAAPLGDALPARSDVPAALRPSIDRAARLCVQPEVTPALLAAMLKAESGFDVDARRPATDEYGVAMWTPRVFSGWAVDGDLNGTKDYMSPPDAIATMGVYLCWIDQELKQHGMRGDLPSWIAASYRTSVRTVVDAGGVPARLGAYVGKVRRYMAAYAPRAATGGSG
ncbi:MAG: lytic transglycosylase domain-containing protein [Streptomyces sp.]|nr:lytic transglycosylase domain-containing protein [Streptomyces sp.]